MPLADILAGKDVWRGIRHITYLFCAMTIFTGEM